MATYIGLGSGTSPESHNVEEAGSSPVRAEIFTGYPTAKVYIGYISHKLSCGSVSTSTTLKTADFLTDPRPFSPLTRALIMYRFC